MRKLVLAGMILPALVLNCGMPSSSVSSRLATSDSRFAVGTAPGIVQIADLNVDGKPDIVVANEQSNNVTILLGDGQGGFTQAKGSPFPAGHSPNDIALGDFNRDGKLDLAFANHEEKYLTVLLGDGQGGFAPAPNSPFAVNVRPHTHGVATGDLNGDGNLDLVTDNWGNNQVAVLYGDGEGGFKTSAKFLDAGKMPYQRLRVADVNGDGKSDIITTNLEGDNVTVLLSDGSGGFKQSAGSPFPCGDSPFNFAVGDVNGDGKPDLAIVNSPGSAAGRHGREGLSILLGDGAGAFRMLTGSPFPTGRIPNLAAIGDVNGDGVGDIAVSSPDGNDVTLFLMNNRGVASSSTIAIGGKPKGLAISDLDGDGKADLVITNNSENTVTVMQSVDVSLLRPTDAAYAEATKLATFLNEHHIAIKSIHRSKLESFFRGVNKAALFKTSRGVLDVIFFPDADGAEKLKVTEQRKDKRYLYSFEGQPQPNPPGDTFNSWQPMYFVMRGNLFIVVSDEQLLVDLKSAFNDEGR